MHSEQRIETSISHAAYRLGYSDIRPHQMQAVKHVMQGKDVFVSLPTGSGKSLIYAVLPFAYDELLGSEGSIVIVVSPSPEYSNLCIVRNEGTYLCNSSKMSTISSSLFSFFRKTPNGT